MIYRYIKPFTQEEKREAIEKMYKKWAITKIQRDIFIKRYV